MKKKKTPQLQYAKKRSRQNNNKKLESNFNIYCVVDGVINLDKQLKLFHTHNLRTNQAYGPTATALLPHHFACLSFRIVIAFLATAVVEVKLLVFSFGLLCCDFDYPKASKCKQILCLWKEYRPSKLTKQQQNMRKQNQAQFCGLTAILVYVYLRCFFFYSLFVRNVLSMQIMFFHWIFIIICKFHIVCK